MGSTGLDWVCSIYQGNPTIFLKGHLWFSLCRRRAGGAGRLLAAVPQLGRLRAVLAAPGATAPRGPRMRVEEGAWLSFLFFAGGGGGGDEFFFLLFWGSLGFPYQISLGGFDLVELRKTWFPICPLDGRGSKSKSSLGSLILTETQKQTQGKRKGCQEETQKDPKGLEIAWFPRT